MAATQNRFPSLHSERHVVLSEAKDLISLLHKRIPGLVVQIQPASGSRNLLGLRMHFRIEGDTVTFWLRVKPRASRERLGLDSAGELRLELHATPTEGQANEACVEFFARLLRLPRSSIEIVTGGKSRRKLIRIRGGEEIARQLNLSVASCQWPVTPQHPVPRRRKQLTTDR